MNDKSIIGKLVTVKIDRPIGTSHPHYPELIYKVNYGYVPGTLAPDNEEQDCYILGVEHPLETFTGTVIAIINRKDDVEEKWVVANQPFSKEEIIKKTYFMEQHFDSDIIL